MGDSLYALIAGAGCSHGHADTDNEILRVNRRRGTTTKVADLSAFIKANPVAQPDPADFEPDGTWYSMVAVRHDLYAVEPNHGEVDRVDPATGAISRVVDVSASQGHIVPPRSRTTATSSSATSASSPSSREPRRCSS